MGKGHGNKPKSSAYSSLDRNYGEFDEDLKERFTKLVQSVEGCKDALAAGGARFGEFEPKPTSGLEYRNVHINLTINGGKDVNVKVVSGARRDDEIQSVQAENQEDTSKSCAVGDDISERNPAGQDEEFVHNTKKRRLDDAPGPQSKIQKRANGKANCSDVTAADDHEFPDNEEMPEVPIYARRAWGRG